MNDNTELLTWAVDNITTWNHDYTHLRSDCSVNPFYTKECARSSWMAEYGRWGTSALVTTGLFHELEAEFSTKTPQVITKQEWETAKLRNAFNTVLEMRHSSSKADNTAQDGSQSQGEAQQGLNEVQVGHIHAKVMAEYAEVAKTNPEPWKEFEYLCGYYKDGEEVDIWEPCLADLCFRAEVKYRRKPSPPKTMNIGGIVVEAWPLEKTPSCGGEFFFVALKEEPEFEVIPLYARGRNLHSFLNSKRAFSTKEQAQAVADALNKVYNDALVGWKGE